MRISHARIISHIRRLLISLLLTLLAFSIFTDTASALSLDQEVSFGLTRSEGGQYVPVFDGIGSSRKTDLLQPNELCALDYSRIHGKYLWHHIVYLDEAGIPHDGYVKESNFELLTISDLTRLMSDPEKRNLIDQYIALAETSGLFTETKTANSAKQAYVLNTNTKKFHYPSCHSVKQMKQKNRKDFTGTREEIINMGYVPCKNCNP